MRRIVLLGSPGSGKSTLAHALADELGLANIQLDRLWHRPGWNHVDPTQFTLDLRAEMDAATNGWVIDGNYNSNADAVRIPDADTLVWLDLPRRTVMSRVIRRTIRRAVRRERLFDQDIREPFSNFYRWDPNENIIRWTWVKFAGYRAKYEARLADGSWAHLDVHRLRTPSDVSEFLDEVRARRQ